MSMPVQQGMATAAATAGATVGGTILPLLRPCPKQGQKRSLEPPLRLPWRADAWRTSVQKLAGTVPELPPPSLLLVSPMQDCLLRALQRLSEPQSCPHQPKKAVASLRALSQLERPAPWQRHSMPRRPQWPAVRERETQAGQALQGTPRQLWQPRDS